MIQNNQSIEIIDDISQAHSSQIDIDILNIIKEKLDNDNNIDNFIQKLKKLINDTYNKQGILNLLEVIEFLSCQENQIYITQFSSKRFLQVLNNKLVNNQTDIEVKQKILKLVSLWYVLYSSQRKFKNFNWYYKNLQQKGIPLSNQASSKYWKSEFKVSDSDQVIDINQNKYTQREKKLLKDLEVVRDLVVLNNEVITNRETEVARELLIRLNKMDKRMNGLPQKLQDNKDVFFYNYVIALQSDIDQTKKRFVSLKDKNIPQIFRSRVAKVVKDEVKRNGIPQKITPENKPSYFETPQQKQLEQIVEDVNEDPFEKLNNVYYQDPNDTNKKNNQTKPKKKTPQKQQQQNDDLNIFGMQTIEDPKQVEQIVNNSNNVKLGPQKNFEYDIDFMNIDVQNNKTTPQQPIQQSYQQYTQPQSMIQQTQQPQQKNYQPSDIISFEKQEKVQIKKQDKIEYDPFSNINDLNFDPLENYQKKNNDEADFLFQLIQYNQFQKNG